MPRVSVPNTLYNLSSVLLLYFVLLLYSSQSFNIGYRTRTNVATRSPVPTRRRRRQAVHDACSPWFYTNLPGYKKTWMWRGDSLWFDRWHEVLIVQPEWVEIISWNDYGESHYIGPNNRGGDSLVALGSAYGEAPFDYVSGMGHVGWRDFLSYAIDLYKNDIATVTKEGVTTWYRPQPGRACDSGGTTGNTATQFQVEYEPSAVAQDKIFFAALLGSPADAYVNGQKVAQWDWTPDGGVGIYRGSAPLPASGNPTVAISRGGSSVASVTGSVSLGGCSGAGPNNVGFNNWNANVNTGWASGSISATPPQKVSQQGCIQGTSVAEGYSTLCNFTCQYDYCPIGACLCTKKGIPKTGTRAQPATQPRVWTPTMRDSAPSPAVTASVRPSTADTRNILQLSSASHPSRPNPAPAGLAQACLPPCAHGLASKGFAPFESLVPARVSAPFCLSQPRRTTRLMNRA